MQRILGCLLLFSVPAALLAQSGAEIRIDPPAPTSRTPVTATISGLWGDGCPPQAPAVTRDGGTIRISFSVSAHPCPIVHIQPEPWKETTFLGVLDAGVYEIEAVVPGTSIGVIGRRTLVVRDAAPQVRVTPDIAYPGQRVRVEAPSISGCPPNVSPCPWPVVEFNGVPGIDITSDNNAILVTVPALAHSGPSEVVDVVVRAFVGSEQVEFRTRAALFVEYGSVYQPAAYERRLIPVLFRGAGAFGSEWTTDVWMENASSTDVTLFKSPFQYGPCHGILDCPRPLPAETTAEVAGTSWTNGFFFYPPRQFSGDIRVNALVRDLSRQSEALGAELPIARERDFAERVVLLNVPSDRRYRVALRIYAHPAPTSFEVPLRIFAMGTNQLLSSPVVVLRPSGNADLIPMNFTFTDVLTQLGIAEAGPLRVEVGSLDLIRPIWAFASATNNTTQHVTIISPQ